MILFILDMVPFCSSATRNKRERASFPRILRVYAVFLYLSIIFCEGKSTRKSSMYAVETQNLIKKYGKTYALKGLDFTVNPSEIMVLLGPNGSGKTTLLMTLATVLKPTAGRAKVMGFDVVKYPTKVRQILGISFQDARGFWRHKPAEILRFHAAMCGIKKGESNTMIEQVLKELELWDARNKLFMHLSGGQAKRGEVAKLLVH